MGSLHTPGALGKVELPDTGACLGLNSSPSSQSPVENRNGLRLGALRQRPFCNKIVTDRRAPVAELSLREWPRSVAVPFVAGGAVESFEPAGLYRLKRTGRAGSVGRAHSRRRAFGSFGRAQAGSIVEANGHLAHSLGGRMPSGKALADGGGARRGVSNGL